MKTKEEDVPNTVDYNGEVSCRIDVSVELAAGAPLACGVCWILWSCFPQSLAAVVCRPSVPVTKKDVVDAV